MSRFAKTSDQAGSLVKLLTTEFKQQGSQYINETNGTRVASLESIDEGQFNQLANARSNVNGLLSGVAKSVGMESLTDMQLEAASIAAFATGSPRAYRQTALNAVAPSGLSVFESAPTGAIGMEGFVPAMEGFNDQKLENYSTFTIAFNMMAAKQCAFGEAFFPMIVQTPDQTYFQAEIRRPNVWNGHVHDRSGASADWKKATLIEALRNPEILKNTVNEAVPVYDAGVNGAQFVSPTLVAPRDVVVGNVTVNTLPLKAIGKGNLLGLIQNPGLIAAGALNQTDELDRNIRIKTVYVKATKGADTDVFAFNVAGNQTSQFQKTPQGHANDVRAALRDRELTLVGKTGGGVTQLDGTAAAALAGVLENQTIRLEVGLDVDLNVESGNYSVSPRVVDVSAVYDADNTRLDPTTFTALSGVAFEVIGFDFDARRTNANRRSRGLIMDVDGYREAYTVGLLSPIVVQRPATGEMSDDDKVKNLALGCYIQMSNNAIATVLNYAETLDAYNTKAQSGLVADIYGGSLEGIGRLLITPYFKRRQIKLMDVVNSLTSQDKVADLRAYFTGMISQDVYEMARQTGMQAAKQVVYGAGDSKDHIVIGTDQVLANYLMIQGDDRTAGPNFGVDIVTTPNMEMYGKIVVAFKDTHVKEGLAVLGFGNLVYIPELVSELPVNREGATIHEVMVQPRFRHICNTPAMIVYDVTDIEEFIVNKAKLLVDNKVLP